MAVADLEVGPTCSVCDRCRERHPAGTRCAPACEDCGSGTMAWGDRLRGWYCVNCDQTESEAINARDEGVRRLHECTECERVGEEHCDVHGYPF